jgi:hypothetical protein
MEHFQRVPTFVSSKRKKRGSFKLAQFFPFNSVALAVFLAMDNEE